MTAQPAVDDLAVVVDLAAAVRITLALRRPGLPQSLLHCRPRHLVFMLKSPAPTFRRGRPGGSPCTAPPSPITSVCEAKRARVRVAGSTSGGVGVARIARQEQIERQRPDQNDDDEPSPVTEPHGVTVAVDQCRRRGKRTTATCARPAQSCRRSSHPTLNQRQVLRDR